MHLSTLTSAIFPGRPSRISSLWHGLYLQVGLEPVLPSEFLLSGLFLPPTIPLFSFTVSSISFFLNSASFGFFGFSILSFSNAERFPFLLLFFSLAHFSSWKVGWSWRYCWWTCPWSLFFHAFQAGRTSDFRWRGPVILAVPASLSPSHSVFPWTRPWCEERGAELRMRRRCGRRSARPLRAWPWLSYQAGRADNWLSDSSRRRSSCSTLSLLGQFHCPLSFHHVRWWWRSKWLRLRGCVRRAGGSRRAGRSRRDGRSSRYCLLWPDWIKTVVFVVAVFSVVFHVRQANLFGVLVALHAEVVGL